MSITPTNKRPFFERHALLVLMLVVFFVPFGLRGARMAVRGMRNDVKDWLPDRFEETKELAKFRELFGGEGFVAVSWDGCTGKSDDSRFRLFVDKFFRETPPSQQAAAAAKPAVSYVNEELGIYSRQLLEKAIDPGFIGNRLGLYVTGKTHDNWGGLNEKWMRGDGEVWFYILPNGEIYKWLGRDTPLAAAGRLLREAMGKENPLEGELMASLKEEDAAWFHEDIRRLEADLIKTVVTGPALLSDLTRPGGALDGDPDAALKRLNGWLYGPDGEQACIFVTLTERGRTNLHRIVGRGILGRPRGKVLEVGAESGLHAPPRPSLLPPPFNSWVDSKIVAAGPVMRMGGPVCDNVAIDEEGQITLVRLVGLSCCIGLLVSWLSFRSLPVVFMLGFVGVVAACLSIAFVWWGGSRMDAVLMSMPSLVYVLGLSGAVHIVNYYRDTVEKEGFPGRPDKAMAYGWKPCTLAAFTTALGLISLATSDIVPIRKFGIFAAVGVVLSLTLLFTFLPAALTLWPPKKFIRESNPDGTKPKYLADYAGDFWNSVGEFVIGRSGLVTLASVLVLATAAWGLPRMKTSVKILNLFEEDNKLIQDYAWLEENLGKLVPVELLVRVDPDSMVSHELDKEATADSTNVSANEKFRLNFLERMEITEHVRRSIDAHFGEKASGITGQAMLAASFVPPLPAAGGSTRQTTMRGAFSRRLATYRDDMLRSDYFRLDEEDQAELWRISLRLSALKDVDYGMFVSELKRAVEPVMSAYKYRDVVLKEIDQSREGGFRGARALMLGVPFGKSGFAGTPTAEALAQAKMPQTDSVATAVMAQRLTFSSTLASLLKSAALNYRDWHDPRFELPVNWQEQAKDYDCVLVFANDARYNLDQIKAAGVPVIDVRDHLYDASTGQQTAAQLGSAVGTTYTGLVPIVYKAQRTLLQSLIESTGWAFVAISIVMMVVLRNPIAGLVSMLPNIFPVVVVFGLMSWSATMVDIGTMMTASVAMGVAVDDTIHFLTWFRRGIADGLERNDAIRLAYDRCAIAMTQTTLIAGLGLFVFALSSFTPTRRFGTLMLALLVTALVGDLIFLPALLAGPFGRLFAGRKGNSNNGDEPGPSSDGDSDPLLESEPETETAVSLGDNGPTAEPLIERTEPTIRGRLPGKPHSAKQRAPLSRRDGSRTKWHL
jgi:predicted RND superfamily exporter protein